MVSQKKMLPLVTDQLYHAKLYQVHLNIVSNATHNFISDRLLLHNEI